MTDTPPNNKKFGSISITGNSETSAEERSSQKLEKTSKPKPIKVSYRSKRIRPQTIGFKWLKSISVAGLAVLLLYLAAGYLLFPWLLTTVFTDKLAQKIERSVTVASASFNPLNLTLTLHNTIVGPQLNDPDDQVDPLLSFSKMMVNFEIATLFRRGFICKQFKIDNFFLHIVRRQDATYNIGEIFTINRSIPFAINNISLSNSRLLFDDQLSGLTHIVEEINLALPALANLPHKISPYIQPKFSAIINGSPLEMSGETVMEEGVLSARLAVQLKTIDLPTYLAYLPTDFNFAITRGKADLDFDIIFAAGGTIDTQLQLQGRGRLHDLLLSDVEDNISRIPEVQFTGSFYPLIQKYHFKELIVERAEIQIDKSPDGQWSFMTQPRTLPSKEQKNNQYILKIDQFLLNNGKLTVTDRFVAGGFTDSLSDVRLNVSSFSNRNNQQASFAINGTNEQSERLSAQGEFSIAPLRIAGLLVIEQLDITRFNPYINNRLSLRIHSGLIRNLISRFVFDRQDNQARANLIFTETEFMLSDFVLAQKNQTWFSMPQLNIQNGSIDIAQRIINLGQVTGNNSHLRLAWDDKGLLNWQQKADYKSNKDKPWITTLHTLQLMNASVDINIKSTAEPLVARIDDIEIKAALSEQQSNKIEIQSATARINETGDIELTGTVSTKPFGGKLTTSLAQLPLADIKPLITPWFTPDVTNGILKTSGVIEFPQPRFYGRIEVRDFTAATSQIGDLVSWQNAVAHNANLTFTPFALKVSNIDFNQPVLNYHLFDQDRTSLSMMFQFQENNLRETKNITPSINISKVEISDGKLSFTDHTVSPLFAAAIPAISGTVKNIHNIPGNRISTSLKGRVSDVAPLTLDGSFGFFDQYFFAEFNSQITDLNIHDLTSYIDPVLGYRFYQGLFSASIFYQQLNRIITTDNKIQLADFKLGDPINGTSKLPLTVALHTDHNNMLTINIPISVNLDNPDVSFQNTLRTTTRSLLLKTAVAPFQFLADILPAQQRIDRLLFQAGTFVLSQDNKAQLAVISGLLKQRPMLNIRIDGYIDAVCDGEAILVSIRKEQAQRQMRKEIKAFKEFLQLYGREELTAPYQQAVPAVISLSLSDQELKEKLHKLAEQRITAVRDYFIEQLGISRYRLLIGRSKTIASDDRVAQCASRVDFILTSETHR